MRVEKGGCRKGKGETESCLLHPNVRKDTQHFYVFVFITVKPLGPASLQRERLHEGVNPGRGGSLEAILETAHSTS